MDSIAFHLMCLLHICKDNKVITACGSGLTDELRIKFWSMGNDLIGKIIEVKYAMIELKKFTSETLRELLLNNSDDNTIINELLDDYRLQGTYSIEEIMNEFDVPVVFVNAPFDDLPEFEKQYDDLDTSDGIIIHMADDLYTERVVIDTINPPLLSERYIKLHTLFMNIFAKYMHEIPEEERTWFTDTFFSKLTFNYMTGFRDNIYEKVINKLGLTESIIKSQDDDEIMKDISVKIYDYLKMACNMDENMVTLLFLTENNFWGLEYE